jgi:hypothetical protein
VTITNGVLPSNTVNLSGLNDGPITATLYLDNDAAGNSFTKVVTTATLDQDKVAETPIVTAPTALTVAAGGSVPLGVVISTLDADDVMSVSVSGVPGFESISAAGASPTVTKHGTSYTYTFNALPASDWNNGLILHSSYPGKGHPTNVLAVTVSNTTAGEGSTAPVTTISVTDPPASASDGQPTFDVGLLGQFIASSFVPAGGAYTGAPITYQAPNQERVLAAPHA